MILATHSLVGAAIGAHVNNPILVAAGSVAMHYLLDTLRHGEYLETMDSRTSFRNGIWKVLLDLSAGYLIIFLVIFWKNSDLVTLRNILIGSIFSILPDFATFLFWLTRNKVLEKIYAFHSWLHPNLRDSKERAWSLRNSINDLAISLISIILFII